MTWNELKEFCNALPEQELEKKVVLLREDESISDIYAERLEEDHYLSDDSEGCFPESYAIEMIDDNPEDYPSGLDDLKKVYDKGHPLLHENF